MDVTKMDAAKAQLATAIRLYFDDQDPIWVHTLAMAAGEIIDRICEMRGLVSMRQGLLDRIKPERRKEIRDRLNMARNFFKHASAEKPDEPLRDFSDDLNLYTIIFASDGLRKLGEDVREAKFFDAWVCVVKPELMLSPLPDESQVFLATSRINR